MKLILSYYNKMNIKCVCVFVCVEASFICNIIYMFDLLSCEIFYFF